MSSTPNPTLVLASSSPYRKLLLDRVLDRFVTCSPDIDESCLPAESPTALVKRLSLAKASALTERFPNALIIGSDQVGTLNDQILTKPGNHENARFQLRACSGQRVVFLTGLCLLRTPNEQYRLHCEAFTAHFRDLSDHEIDTYLQAEKPFDCAGSFRIEGPGIGLFRALEGRDPNSLMGLPLIALCDMLREQGLNPLLQPHRNNASESAQR